MSRAGTKIPFHIDVSRVIDILATQIYQSPLALLRENTQNAFDAILLRRQLDDAFTPAIDVQITESEITITDNGIGMTKTELSDHYWRAGSSSKNNPAAKAAGVVGTFGIGAMANFGIADELILVSESTKTGERTRCVALKETLSTDVGCIDVSHEASRGEPGTTVVAKITSGTTVDIRKAIDYLRQFVNYIDIPVHANGELLSQKSFLEAVKAPSEGVSIEHKQRRLTPSLTANIALSITRTGEVWIRLENMTYSGIAVVGVLVLRQRTHKIATFRSGFGLSTAAANSAYFLGGVADLLAFQPTAGREALSTESMQLLQSIVTQIDRYISEEIGQRPEANSNTDFMTWVVQNKRDELCSHLLVRVEPDARKISLGDIKKRTKKARMRFYRGRDQDLISSVASPETPLIVISTSRPRLNCELRYLQKFCNVEEVKDKPTVLDRKPLKDYSLDDSGLVFRITNTIESDYFVQCNVGFGHISHNVPIWVDVTKRPVEIVLNESGSNVQVMLELYNTDYHALDSYVKDFVRNVVFPHIASLVPSSTRQGATAFLKLIRQPKEFLEYEASDQASLSEIWQDYAEGNLSLVDAARRSSIVARRSMQIVDSSQARPIAEVVPDVVDNQRRLEVDEESRQTTDREALPAIERRDIPCTARLLTIGPDEEPLKGYRAFLAITDRVRKTRGDFFSQPHTTEVVWGGQKVLFIFQHHSGNFGLYYDILTSDVVAPESSGRAFPTCTLALQDNIYIPIPEEIHESFIPRGSEKKRFEIRCDLLYPERDVS